MYVCGRDPGYRHRRLLFARLAAWGWMGSNLAKRGPVRVILGGTQPAALVSAVLLVDHCHDQGRRNRRGRLLCWAKHARIAAQHAGHRPSVHWLADCVERTIQEATRVGRRDEGL